jgi:hypothetical protein
MVYVVAVPALVLGFLAGLLAVKRSSQWCPGCGETLRCVRCAGQPTRAQAARRVARQR